VIFLCFALSGFSSRGIKNDQTKDKNAYYSEKLEKIKIPYKKQT
jgi:hypothetical protein